MPDAPRWADIISFVTHAEPEKSFWMKNAQHFFDSELR